MGSVSRPAKARGPDCLPSAGVVGIAGAVVWGQQPEQQTCSGVKTLLEFKNFQHSLEPCMLIL